MFKNHFWFVGLPGIEPGLQDPQPRVLPVYYSPILFYSYCSSDLIHRSQALSADQNSLNAARQF